MQTTCTSIQYGHISKRTRELCQKLFVFTAIFNGLQSISTTSLADDLDPPTAPGIRPVRDPQLNLPWKRLGSLRYDTGSYSGVTPNEILGSQPKYPILHVDIGTPDITNVKNQNYLIRIATGDRHPVYTVNSDGSMYIGDENGYGYSFIRGDSHGRKVFGEFYEKLRGVPYNANAVSENPMDVMLQFSTRGDPRLLERVRGRLLVGPDFGNTDLMGTGLEIGGPQCPVAAAKKTTQGRVQLAAPRRSSLAPQHVAAAGAMAINAAFGVLYQDAVADELDKPNPRRWAVTQADAWAQTGRYHDMVVTGKDDTGRDLSWFEWWVASMSYSVDNGIASGW